MKKKTPPKRQDPLVKAAQKRKAKTAKATSRTNTALYNLTGGLRGNSSRYAEGLPGRKNHVDIRNVTTAHKKAAAIEYVKDFDITAAAQRANLKRGTLWTLVHKDAEFLAMLDAASRTKLAGSIISAERLLIAVSNIADSNIGNFLRADEDGNLFFDFSQATPAQLEAIMQLEQDEEYVAGLEEAITAHPPRIIRHSKVRMYDKQVAQKIMMQYHKLIGGDVPPGAGLPGNAPPPALIVQFIDGKKEQL